MKNTVVQKHKAVLPLYVKGLYQHKYTLKQASESTGYTIQHLCRLKKKYAELGNAAFTHGNIGHIPPHKIDAKLRQKRTRAAALPFSSS